MPGCNWLSLALTDTTVNHPACSPLKLCSANVSNGVPQVTTCSFSIGIGIGGSTKFLLWGYRGDPTNPLPTDLITAQTKAFYPQE